MYHVHIVCSFLYFGIITMFLLTFKNFPYSGVRIPSHACPYLPSMSFAIFIFCQINLIIQEFDIHSIQIWDRRCCLTIGKPAGVLSGHVEGITFIDSRRDGRYFISNGKDQSIKLWDIRRMSADAIKYVLFFYTLYCC